MHRDDPESRGYESINEKMFGAKGRRWTSTVSSSTPPARGPDGFRVIDIWESREAFDDFMSERVMPAMEEAGMSMEGGQAPTIIELTTVVVNEAARV